MPGVGWVSVLVDGGVDFGELHGAEIVGTAEPVGEIPRVGTPDDTLVEPERLFATKYLGRPEMQHDQRHAWLRITPTKIVSWDFRKMGRA